MNNAVASKWSDLSVRVISVLVLLPFVLAAIWYGGDWFAIMIVAMGVLIAHEFTSIAFVGNIQQFALFLLTVLGVGFLTHSGRVGESLIVVGVLAVFSIASSFRNLSSWKIIGVPYVALPVLGLLLLRDDPAWGFYAILWCALLVWCADTFAYFAGRLIGGPKLAPVLSPKKTWAGLGGAIAGASLVSIVFVYFLHLNLWILLLLAIVFALIEQAGDILESALKRSFGVKDSGNLIPGHGGILDRVDGLMVVVLAAALVGYLHNPLSAAEGLLHW
jgi:phosphatidate cytidylyltransferase